ncbi:transposase [Candidatus Saccharibacteria bacterium]|nr:transposase [Candidatus Saccharibacteria bacterium]
MVYKNTARNDYGDAFYHVYNRGVDKMNIFRDEEDFRYFEYLLNRYLTSKPTADKLGRKYKNYYDQVAMHSYCLMPNHFHFLLWQKEAGDIKRFMASLGTAYGMYFNLKYKRRGPLFESEYKSVNITEDPQLVHVSRYIHLNPIGYRLWDHSSYSDYLYSPRDWITTSFILGMFPSKQKYLDFVDDYEDVKRANDKYKSLLDE